MVLGVSQTPFWLIALPVIGALLGVIVGQLGPEFFRRRAIAEARYDAAIIAVSKAFAARHGISLSFPSEWVRSPNEAAHAATEHELSKAALGRFLDAAAEARAALASLYPWSSDLRCHWDRPLLKEDEFDALITILTERRKAPFKRYAADSSTSKT